MSAEQQAPRKLQKAPADFQSKFDSGEKEFEPPTASAAVPYSRSRPRFNRKARLFIGNLATDDITEADVRNVFAPHGTVTEVALNTSFGFVQFATEEEADRAMSSEQGRDIGGKSIDIQKAKNETHPSSRGPGYGSRGRPRGRSEFGNQRNNFHNPRHDNRMPRGRDRSPGRGRFNQPSIDQPVNGCVVRIILLGEMQRNFAENAANSIRSAGSTCEIEMLDGRTLSQALRDAEQNRSRYVMIVGRDNLTRRKITLKMMHLRGPNNRCPTYELDVPEIVNAIVQEEQALGVNLNAQKPPSLNGIPGQNANQAGSILQVQAQLKQLQDTLLQRNTPALSMPQQHVQPAQPVQPQLDAAKLQEMLAQQQQLINQLVANQTTQPPRANPMMGNMMQPSYDSGPVASLNSYQMPRTHNPVPQHVPTPQPVKQPAQKASQESIMKLLNKLREANNNRT